KGPVETLALGDVTDPVTGPPGGLPEHADRPGRERLQAEQDPEQGRLADPVRTEDRGEGPSVDIEIHTAPQHAPAEPHLRTAGPDGFGRAALLEPALGSRRPEHPHDPTAFCSAARSPSSSRTCQDWNVASAGTRVSVI